MAESCIISNLTQHGLCPPRALTLSHSLPLRGSLSIHQQRDSWLGSRRWVFPLFSRDRELPTCSLPDPAATRRRKSPRTGRCRGADAWLRRPPLQGCCQATGKVAQGRTEPPHLLPPAKGERSGFTWPESRDQATATGPGLSPFPRLLPRLLPWETPFLLFRSLRTGRTQTSGLLRPLANYEHGPWLGLGLLAWEVGGRRGQMTCTRSTSHQ